MKSILILYADSAIGEVVLPQLHTIVEFAVPRAVSGFRHPDLKQPIRQTSFAMASQRRNIWWRTIRPKGI